MKTFVIAPAAVAISLFAALPALAQGAEAEGEANVELGASEATDVELGAGGRSRSRVASGAPGGELRLGLQVRLGAVQALSFNNVGGFVNADPGQAPIVTPGVRLIDGKLFLGLGLGLNGYDEEEPDGDEEGRAAFTFSPLGSYDIVTGNSAALSLLGWLNLASLGETEVCTPQCVDQGDDIFGWGLNLGMGVRGFLSPGLSIGGEFGWGFLTASQDGPGGVGDFSVFEHGLFGNLLFEASVGL